MCAVRKEEESAIGGEMPGVTKYNLVDDAHDLRIPMHNDEVFKHGVCFEAKVRTGFKDTDSFTAFTSDSLWNPSVTSVSWVTFNDSLIVGERSMLRINSRNKLTDRLQPTAVCRY